MSTMNLTGQRFSSYLDFIKEEHQQILAVKWVESERLGHDCGIDYAIFQWSMRHREKWIEALKASGQYPSQ